MTKDNFFHATLMPDKDWWQVLWSDPAGVLKQVGVEPGMEVVDLCCGDGHFTKPMCELVQPGKTWALDLNEDLLNTARQACKDNPNFHAIPGDARELAQQIGREVDFIFIANTFHGVPDKTGLAKAVYSCLKKEGQFAVINWHPRPREETVVLDQPRGPDTKLRMKPEEVQQVVEAAGFKLEKVTDVGPYHYAAIFVK